MTSKGPSRHLSWDELACVNRLGRSFGIFEPGEIVATYPQEWRADRAVRLATTFEAIRKALGNEPLFINSAYRTSDYNRAVGGVRSSQHVFGRALDIRHSKLTAADVFLAIHTMRRAGKLPMLGGLGRYPTFVHIDVRPSKRLAVWFGSTKRA